MLKIRLQRLGRSKRPNYRIVVAEHTAAPQGKYIDQLGSYDPLSTVDALKVDTDKVLEWIKKGAQPSNTLARLLKGNGVKGMEPYIVEMKDKKKKKEEEEKPVAPVAAEPEAEEQKTEEQAPVEEVSADEPVVEEAPVEEVSADEPVVEE
ncbi:30S ribosomal protein S16, partial [Patescibacteria group bacterium]|nr:30S ribosomal protein S16 [Patescibacteria group bacterium]